MAPGVTVWRIRLAVIEGELVLSHPNTCRAEGSRHFGWGPILVRARSFPPNYATRSWMNVMRARMPAAPDRPFRSLSGSLFWSFVFAGLTTAVGCSLWRDEPELNEHAERLMKVPDPPSMVREAAYTTSLQYLTIQSYGLVNNLAGTGSIEPPSMERDLLLRDLQARDIDNPNQFIDSPDTAIVLVETVLQPGHRAGDPLDLTIRTPIRTDLNNTRCTSLLNGWLMPTRLAFTQVLQDGKPHSSDLLATGTGPIILRQSHEATADGQAMLEGRIIGGGRVKKDGALNLRIRADYRHVLISKALADAINRRFYYVDGTTRRGIANAREDDFIELEVADRYRQNVHRMFAVILALTTEKDLGKIHQRMELLGRQLEDPVTAQDAALQLEAIGEESVPVLLKGLESNNPELQFYAAEALAYLDNEAAIEPLTSLCRIQPAFRYQALLALSGMPQQAAINSLRQLFDESSTETRAGAFDAIRRRPDRDRILRGQRILDGQGEIAKLYEIPTRGTPLVWVSLRRSPDIVVFGGPAMIQLSQPMLGKGGVIVQGDISGGLKVSRVVTGRPDAKVVVPATVEGLVAGVGKVGGSYGDIVECLRELKQQEAFSAQLAIDIFPEPLREYHRESSPEVSASKHDELPPQPIDPPKKEEDKGWYDPRGWFGRIDLGSQQTVS